MRWLTRPRRGPCLDLAAVRANEARLEPTRRALVSVSAYCDVYQGRRGVESIAVGFLPLLGGNGLEGHVKDLGTRGAYPPRRGWRLSAVFMRPDKARADKAGAHGALSVVSSSRDVTRIPDRDPRMAARGPSTRARNGLTAAAASLALCAVLAQPAWADGPSLEYGVKADYLYKFTPFVEWPSTAFDGPVGPFKLCVAGRDPFGPVVDEAVRERKVGDHPIIVVRLKSVDRGAACHLLFLGHSRLQSPRRMLAAVDGQPVLTVADDRFPAKRAMIQFVLIDGHVRFEIRSALAQGSGLVVSSKLEALSATTRGEER